MSMQVFVYGTLKQGQKNFANYCRNASQVEPASVIGRLYHLPVGYPMLVVPPASILAIGTADLLADCQLPQRLASGGAKPLVPFLPAGDNAEGFEPIHGEILTFPDPQMDLPAIEILENFYPGCSDRQSLYWRVLVRAQAPDNRPVWTYVAANGILPAGAVRCGSRWG